MPASPKFRVVLFLTVALGTLIWTGCSEDDKSSPPPGGATSSSFTGVFSNGTENGSMSVTIASTTLAPKRPVRSIVSPASRSPRAVVTAIGTLKKVGGGTVALTGTYNDVSDSLNLANAGAGYTFGGEYDTTGTFDAISGGYTGPGGSGFFGS